MRDGLQAIAIIMYKVKNSLGIILEILISPYLDFGTVALTLFSIQYVKVCKSDILILNCSMSLE